MKLKLISDKLMKDINKYLSASNIPVFDLSQPSTKVSYEFFKGVLSD